MSHSMKKLYELVQLCRGLKKYDFSFFAITGILFIIGVLNLYSATHASTSTHIANLYKMQIFWYFLSCSIGIGISLIRPKNFFRYSWVFYIFTVFLLILVLLLGHKEMGAKRWLLLGSFRIQPSEITKITLVLILAKLFSRSDNTQDLGIKELIFPFIITIIPVILIVMGPDLGTGLTLLLIFCMVAFYKKLRWKAIGILCIVGLIGGVLMYNFGLEKYQKERIMTFFNPEKDVKGSGYNAIQSKIAIGSGKFLGKGFLKSSQASLQYLPENHTDFVFSIFGEEHGLVGSFLIIVLYIILLLRFLWLASCVPKIFDSTVIVGIMSIFFWHIFINMAMVMGLMPIVGLPLPYMSYGGSSLLSFSICCGMATSISNTKNLF